MNALARREQILEQLHIHHRVTVKQLVELFDISEVTIRGDLKQLESKGKLQRYHGGAYLVNVDQGDISVVQIDSDYEQQEQAKERIAIKASSYIKSGASVIFDSGRTTHLVAKHIKKSSSLHIVITNNLLVADELCDEESLTLVMTGGTYRPLTKSLHGNKAEQCLEGVSADILFIGADGIDPDKGITTFNAEYTISNVMTKCAQTVIAVVDSTKLGRVCYNKVLDVANIDILIIDDGITEAYLESFKDKGVNVIVV